MILLMDRIAPNCIFLESLVLPDVIALPIFEDQNSNKANKLMERSR
jgi:hypothetical protein